MTSATEDSRSEKGLARVAQSLAGWTEKWFPDAYVVALAGVVLVAVAALANGSSPQTVVNAFGDGFWDLTAFTLQMAMVVLTGYVVATSPPVARLIDRLATDAPDGEERGEFRCVPGHVGVLPELGAQPGLRRSAGPGDRPSDRSAGGLSRARRRGLHGAGRRVGPGHVLLGRTAAGNRQLAACRRC